jgi:serine/threonine protein kinase
MVNYDPQKRPSIEDILDDPWLKEYNKLTDEEKKKLENEVIEKEFEEREKILEQNNKNKNLINIKDIIEQAPNMDNKSSGKINESYFDENCKLESIDENNLNLKYYLNIKGTSNPNDLMNALVEKVKAIEIKDDEFRNLDIIPNDKYYKFDVILENNDKEIP